MEKEVKFIIDNESSSYEILKSVPAVHRNTFLHLAIVNAVNTEFYNMMVKGEVINTPAVEPEISTTSTPKTSTMTIDWDL